MMRRLSCPTTSPACCVPERSVAPARGERFWPTLWHRLPAAHAVFGSAVIHAGRYRAVGPGRGGDDRMRSFVCACRMHAWGEAIGTVTIRNLDNEAIDRIRQQAKVRNRSLEAELRVEDRKELKGGCSTPRNGYYRKFSRKPFCTHSVFLKDELSRELAATCFSKPPI